MKKMTDKQSLLKVVDPAGQTGKLKRIGGSNSDIWNILLANQALSSLWTKQSAESDKTTQREGTIAGMMGIAPRDELEGMLAVQLISSHNAAMECYRRAMLPEQSFQARSEALSQANKLSRTYTVLLDALNRHRGKGQQKVTVEHVHVYEGGQAIVGHVEGGGVRTKTKDQPHALRHAQCETMRSENTKQENLPIAGNGKW
jgi:hypothetical protein